MSLTKTLDKLSKTVWNLVEDVRKRGRLHKKSVMKKQTVVIGGNF